MKKLCLVLFFLSTLRSVSFAEFDVNTILKNRRETLKSMQEDVIKGRFPVYLSVSCEDNSVSNKLKSLMTSALRKKDNVKIVANRDSAWFWIYIVALKQTKKWVAISVVFGEDKDAYYQEDFDNVFSLGTQDILNREGFSIYSWSYDTLGELASQLTDKFDVKVLEQARQMRERYLEYEKNNP